MPSEHPAFKGSFTLVNAGVVSHPAFTITGETVQTVEDALLYCCSFEDTPELRSRMRETLGADIVFEISDIHKFGSILAMHPLLAFRQFECGRVTYSPVARGPSALELSPVDIFRKDLSRFEWQKEYRLLWAGEVFQQSEIVEEPLLASLLTRIA